MSLHRLKIYLKLSGIALLFVVVLIFMISNRQRVEVNFLFWEIWGGPLFVFIFAVANLGILVFLVVRKIRKVIIDLKQIKREDKARQKLVDEVKKETEQSKSTN